MTVVNLSDREPVTVEPRHALVAAVLAIADNRGAYIDSDWATILAGLGPAMDDIADDLANARAYEAGLRDWEAGSDRKAEAMADRLRANATHSAAFVASLVIAGVTA